MGFVTLIERPLAQIVEAVFRFGKTLEPADLTANAIQILEQPPLWPEFLTPLPAAAVMDEICAHAGARARDRDEVDTRIVQDFQQRAGRIIDSQEQVEGYPQAETTHHELAVPERDVHSEAGQST